MVLKVSFFWGRFRGGASPQSPPRGRGRIRNESFFMHWILFLVLSAIIVYSGRKLSIYGDQIADKTGMGGSLVGIILLASVTSLPELVTGVSAVFQDMPDIAAGGIFGSCLFNLLIIALLDFLLKDLPISTKADRSHVLSASFSGFLLIAGAWILFLAPKMSGLKIGWVGFDSILFLMVYVLAMKLVFQHEKKKETEEVKVEEDHSQISLKKTILFFTIHSIIIFAAAIYLPTVADQIAEQTGLGKTFVGSIFLSLTTSLPEVTISIAALRMGAIDMAFGNIFGSNLFNLAIYGIEDLFYTKGSLAEVISINHAYTAMGAVLMTVLAIIGLTYRASKKSFVLAGDALAIFVVYVLTTTLLYLFR